MVSLAGPLSPLTYLRRNPRRILPLFLAIALAVFAVSLTAVLTGSMIASHELTWVKPYERYALIGPVQGALDPGLVRLLQESPHVQRLLPVASASIRVHGIFGSEPRPVLRLAHGDIRWFLRTAGLELAAGRLPAPGVPEIVLHRDIVRSKGIGVGSAVGRAVDEDEFLPGRLTVVGVLSGPYPLGLTSEGGEGGSGAAPGGPSALLAFPKPGHARDLDSQLSTLPRQLAAVATHTLQKRRFEREVANLDATIWILNLVTTLSLSLSVGTLNLLFFFQRLGEYGILGAIGYSGAFLLRRTLAEVAVLTAVGWACGLGLARLVFLALGRLVYAPKGIALVGIDGRVLAYTLPVPVMVAAFSVGVVLWGLWRLDPVAVVERRE